MALSAGARVGPFEVVSLLGAGGMGEVYRARDVNLRRDVAIKVLPDAFAAAPERVARFEREARALAALNHPNIATIHRVEVIVPAAGAGQGPKHALVLELVDGDTLDAVIRRGPVPIREALVLARAIADALEAAHEKGIVHRDLKPANIKITPTGVVKVLDFGLAKSAGDDPVVSQLPTIDATREGVVLGTAAYMSPEQARGKPVDKRTDIWAFGCVLYEMVTGRVAFSGETLSDVIVSVLEREPDWTILPASVPTAIKQLLHRSVEKDPHRRLRDIGDARLAIEDVLANRDSETAAAVPSAPRWVATVAAVICGVAIGATGMQVLAPRAIRDRATPRQVRFTIAIPPDSAINPSQNRQEAVSPDGARIAYVGLKNGQRTLYLRAVDDLEAKPIDNVGAATGPFFSPDGQWLGFVRAGGGGLMKIALSGGAPVTIAKPTGVQGSAWSEDGTIVFVNGSLWRVPASGGDMIEAAKPDTARGERAFRAPQFLPGGKTVLLTVSTEDAATYDDARIVAMNLATGEKKTLVEGGMSARYSSSGHLVYARNGTLLAVPFDAAALQVTGPPFEVLRGVFMSINSGFAEFDIARDGTLVYSPGDVEGGERVPVWVDRQGNAEPLPLPPRSYLHPRLSRDARSSPSKSKERRTISTLTTSLAAPSHD